MIETTSTEGFATSARQSEVEDFEPEFVGASAREALLDFAERDPPHDWRIAENRPHPRPGERMALAHVARADQSDPDRLHGRLPPCVRIRTRHNKYFTRRAIWNIRSIRKSGAPKGFRRRPWAGGAMDDPATEPPQSFEALKRLLIEIEPHLPKRLRQAAGYALEHPDEFALGTASAIARSAHVQASTLVRFAQTLGFGGFSDLQEVFRSHLRNRWPDYPERLKALHESARDSGDPTHLLSGFANSAASSLARLRDSIQRRDLDRAIALLSARERSIASASAGRSACRTTSPMRWGSSASPSASSTMSAAWGLSRRRAPARTTR